MVARYANPGRTQHDHEADLPTLENYCTAIGTVREAQREINKHGLIIHSAKRRKAQPRIRNSERGDDHGAALRERIGFDTG